MPRPRTTLLAAALAAGLAVPGCHRAEEQHAPSLSADRPADGPSASAAAPDPSGSADPDPPPPQTWTTIVDLHGELHAPPPIPDGAPRLASIAMLTEVHKAPNPDAAKVGYLRAGAVVETEPEEHGKAGCPGGWRKIKPYGFVCLGPEATLDLDHPIARALTRRPDVGQKLPYMYGIATRGGPVYARIPTDADLKEYEPHLATHLAKWKKDKESGATYGLDVWLKWRADKDKVPTALDALAERTTDPDIPWFLRDSKTVPNLSGKVKTPDAVKIDDFVHHNGVAFVESFLSEGRRYNVSTDLRVLPADRFRPIRGSDFHGWVIGEDIDFPFALVRKKGAKKYRFDGHRMAAAGDLEWRTAVKLTGKQKMEASHLYYETADGFYVDDHSAGRVDPAKKMPAWGKNGERWIDVNITKQVLVAYEGTKPVYTTLVSSGEAGLGDPDTTKSTKRGIFRIHTKYLSITMDSSVVGEEFELRDVPYVEYFENGYALHGAYWHDVFGQPKSHGCVNLAPEDARRLFFWTEPQIPPGWHGVARSLTGTVVFVHP
jgi:lipoprotein-anchoring transpeptidase ErfK/SrfK